MRSPLAAAAVLLLLLLVVLFERRRRRPRIYAGIPEVPDDVPGIAALGRWASKAPPPPGPRPPSRSISGVLEARS